MPDIYYPSEGKRARAQSAVLNYSRLAAKKPGKAEYKLVAEGKDKKLEGKALEDYVYEGLAGAPRLQGAQAVEAKERVKEAKAKARKRQGEEHKRSRIVVK